MTDNQGWICPRCQRVYAPFVRTCELCNSVPVKPKFEAKWEPLPDLNPGDTVSTPGGATGVVMSPEEALRKLGAFRDD